jgi:hypothetical protein
MATDPRDKERLDRLEKLAEQKAATRDSQKPWQELLSRSTSIPGAKSLEAAKVISGIAGGWASFIERGIGVCYDGALAGVSAPQVKTYKLGQPGVPEINFVPYNHGTNRFATKGPSLLGHPIALSVVGPTLKSPTNTWQWTVTDNSGTPGTGDELELDLVDSALSTPGFPTPPVAATIQDLYNIPAGNVDLTYPGGLYMVILQTGAPGWAGAAPSPGRGLSDGMLGDGAGAGNSPLIPNDITSKYEIFRVETIRTDSLVLDPAKRLADYFTVPVGPAVPQIAGVMFFEPQATRMVAMPGSGPLAQEKTFVVVPPERAATGEHWPPYDGGSPGDGTWLRGGFDPDNLNLTNIGTPGDYQVKVTLPLPRPLDVRWGRAQLTSDGPAILNTGIMILKAVNHTTSVTDVGKIFKIYKAAHTGTAPYGNIGTPEGDYTTEDNFLGWFEVWAINGPSEYRVRRVVEVDPITGRPYWGSSESMWIDDSVNPGNLDLKFSVHEPVSVLHSTKYTDLDKLESARLTNIIDPTWVERSAKTPNLPEGVSPARADRAIWDTSGGNPGSFLDLGFRMVLYPAIEGTGAFAGTMLPDWAHPIDSREVTLDPTITDEEQWVDIDYSAGTVTLSHEPVPGPGCDVAPNGIVSSDNPKGGIVLFASCVPYSMEEGQTGGGVRATSMLTDTTIPCVAGADASQVDVFGERIIVDIAPLVDGAPQTITSGVMRTIFLQEVYDDLPESGFIELRVDDENGAPAMVGPGGEDVSLYGYTQKVLHFDTARLQNITQLVGCYGGGLYGTDTVAVANHVGVVRRDIRTPITPDAVPGTAYSHDTTYGFAKRSDTLRFRDTTLTPRVDGSLEVTQEDFTGTQGLLADLFSSWALSGGLLSFPGGLVVDVSASDILIEGKKLALPAGSVTLPAVNGPYYIYVDGTTDPLCPVYSYDTTLPIPGPNADVLLGRVDVVGGVVDASTYIDLRNPLKDIDRRVDITVGDYGAWAPADHPHFVTLAEAIAYVGEMMEPPSGNSGRSWRIKVIGYTNETAVPIVMPTDGIIIEGAAVRRAGGPGSQTTVRWNAAATPLFELNGKTDLVFDNLAFEYENTGQPNDATFEQVVFAQDVGGAGSLISERLVVSNCRFKGNTRGHGFLCAYTSTSGFQDIVLENNVVEVSDFFFASAGPVQRCTFRGNRIRKDSAEQSALYDAFYIRTNVIEDNYYIDNTVSFPGDPSFFSRGFGLRSLLSGATRSVIESNLITATREMAIHLEDYGGDDIIRGNFLLSVHTSGSFSYTQPDKVGIWQEGTAGVNTYIRENFVTISAPNAPSRGVLTKADDCSVADNRTNQTIEVVDLTRVTGNLVDTTGASANILTGSSCVVSTNHVDTITTSSSSVLSDNIVRDTLNPGTASIVSSNQVTVGLVIADECVIQGNRVPQLNTGGVLVSDVTITGNIFEGGNSGVVSLLRATITGNRFGVVAPQPLVVTLNDCTFGENIIEGIDPGTAANLTLSGSDNTVTGNRLTYGSISQGSGTDNIITGNYCLFLAASGAATVITGNKVVENLSLTSSANGVVTGNQVSVNLSVLVSAGATITGNTAQGNVTVTGNGVVVDGNKVGGILTVTGTGTVVSDNEPPMLTVTGSDTVAKGNKLVPDTTGGTAQGPGSGADTIVLAAAAGLKPDDYYNGYTISITAGTGSGQVRLITDFDSGTIEATVDTNWVTPPDNTSVYSMVGGVLTITGGTDHSVSGNHCTGLSVVAEGSSVQGNHVTDELTLVGTSPSPGAAGAVVMGNMVEVCDIQAANILFMGNRVLATGGVGIRNSAAGDAEPNGFLLIGNMMGDSGGGSIAVFLNGSWTTQVNDKNEQGS